MENQIPKSEIKTWKIKVDNFFLANAHWTSKEKEKGKQGVNLRINHTLKPSNGEREQLVTNLSSWRFCVSVNWSTTRQKESTQGWSPVKPPETNQELCPLENKGLPLFETRLTGYFSFLKSKRPSLTWLLAFSTIPSLLLLEETVLPKISINQRLGRAGDRSKVKTLLLQRRSLCKVTWQKVKKKK